MYLLDFDATQVSDPSHDPFCTARVRWVFGDQDAHVIDFWWRYPGQDIEHWTPAPPQVPITDDSPTEADIVVPAGIPIEIRACPRLLDDRGTLEFKQPDEAGTEKVFEDFCAITLFSGQRLPGEVRDRCKTPPRLETEVGYGTVTARWTNPEGYDRFRIEFIDANAPRPPFETGNESLEYTFEKVPEGSCQVRVAGIHNGRVMTGSQDCASPWAEKEDMVRSGLGYVKPKFTPGAPLGTARQRAKHQEVFACLPDGRPLGIWASDSAFHGWYDHGNGNGNGPAFPASAPLTGLSRDDGFMDLFGVAKDGRVYLAWWHGNPWQEWFVLSDPVFKAGARIAAVARNTDQMDIFIVDKDGVVRSNWWNGDPWRDWFPLPGAVFPAGAPIAAITRTDDHMDIFAVGTDGIVRSNWWNGKWEGWFPLPGELFVPGSSIAAITRTDDHMDVFVVGSDGIVRGIGWNGNPWGAWYPLPGAGFPAGAPIVAQAFGDGSMNVAAVATDGQTWFNRWNGDWAGWRVISNAQFPAGANLSANAWLYGVAADGHVRQAEISGRKPIWMTID